MGNAIEGWVAMCSHGRIGLVGLGMVWLLGSCGPSAQLRAMQQHNEKMEADNQRLKEAARQGFPDLSSPAYAAALTRFKEDEAVLRANPSGFFTPGPALECALTVEMEAELWLQFPGGLGGKKNELSIYQGRCEGGVLSGPAVIGFYYEHTGQTLAGAPPLRGLAVANFERGVPVGDVVFYSTSLYSWERKKFEKANPVVVDSLISGNWDVEYGRVDGRSWSHLYKFSFRAEDSAWHYVLAVEPESPGLLRARLFSGSAEVLSSYQIGSAKFRVPHGPHAARWQIVRGEAPTCFDLGKVVVQDPCPIGLPANYAGIERNFEIAQENKRGAIRDFLRSARSAGTSAASTGTPVFVQPKTASRSGAAATPTPTVAIPLSAATTGPVKKATLPPKEQVEALCASAASRQGELYAPGDAKLRKTMAASFKTDCRKSHWSMERITCVLGAADASALGSCEALPAAEPEFKAGDPLACAAAAEVQGGHSAGSDASLRKTLSKSIASLCKSERWSAARIRCVLKSQEANEASQCATAQ